MTAGYRRIAVFRALYLGDMLCAVPAFRALRLAYPEAEITLIGLPWAKQFVARFGKYIDRFVEFKGFPGIDEVPVDPRMTQDFLAEQRAYDYDLALQMHGSGETSSRFVAALGARVSAGYASPHLTHLLTYSQRYPNDQPEIVRNLNLVRLVDAGRVGTVARHLRQRFDDTRLEFPLFESDRREAAQVCARAGMRLGEELTIGLHPGAKTPCRRWPAEYFAELGDMLADSLNARIVITGSGEEQPLAEKVASQMCHRASILCGQTSLGELAALIDSLDLLVTNSTGPAHLAEAVDTPAVILFGPTEYRRWAPMDQSRQRAVRRPVECSPCENWECPIDHRCLRDIPPRWVAAVAEQLVQETQGGRTPGSGPTGIPARVPAGLGRSELRSPAQGGRTPEVRPYRDDRSREGAVSHTGIPTVPAGLGRSELRSPAQGGQTPEVRPYRDDRHGEGGPARSEPAVEEVVV